MCFFYQNAQTPIYFLLKTAHGLQVTKWDNISVMTIDIGKVKIKYNSELW